jgi:hypothetical protein
MSRGALKGAAACGIGGPALLAVVLVVLSILERDFMRSLGWNPLTAPTHDWPSGLALGPAGLVMTMAFVACGLMLVFFAWGLEGVFPRTPARSAASILLALAGFAMTFLAFPTDPTDRTGPATLHGRIHDGAFAVLGGALLVSLAIFGFVFLAGNWRASAVLSWATVALIVPSFLFKGAVFYLFLAAVLAWCETAAFRLLAARAPWTRRPGKGTVR